MSAWPRVKLGELVQQIERKESVDPAKEYRLLGVRLEGFGPFLRETVIGSQSAATKLSRVENGDFIYSRLFAWRGAFGLIPKELDGCYVSNEFPTFRANEHRLDARFLRYWFRLRPTIDAVAEHCTGSTPLTRNRFKEEFFNALQIPLPPLAEQRRLVERIDALASKIEEARRLREEGEKQFLALDRKSSSRILRAASGGVPAKPLSELTTRITKGESPAWQGFSYQENGPLFIRSENVLWGKLDLTKKAHISTEFHEKLRRSQLQPEDVLINLVGASIGRACKVPNGLGPANVNQAVGVISPIAAVLQSDFLLSFLLSEDTQAKLHGGKVETARPNISLRDVMRIQIPLIPLGEQCRIVANLRKSDAMRSEFSRVRDGGNQQLAALLPAILDQAFRGEL